MSSQGFDELVQSYSAAYRSQNWVLLAQIGEELSKKIGGKFSGTVKDIREIAKIYLGSLVGSGEFLTNPDSKLAGGFTRGLNAIENFASENEVRFKGEFSSIIKSGYEIQLFLTSKKSDARNKAASALRKLARPDLAIQLASQQLEVTRLNYYSLVVRCSAYCDLSNFNSAILDGKKALRYSPVDKKHFPLVSLTRAYVERFQQTGDLSDCEEAFSLAEKSFELKPDEYSANVFLRVIYAIGLTGMEALIANLQNIERKNTFQLDEKAIEIAKEVLRNTTPGLGTFEPVEADQLLADESFDDWLSLESEESFDSADEAQDLPEDYFEDYFEDFADSLNDPQRPHLEP